MRRECMDDPGLVAGPAHVGLAGGIDWRPDGQCIADVGAAVGRVEFPSIDCATGRVSPFSRFANFREAAAVVYIDEDF
jgi:hypothetical protein